jgi:endonuclease/exonuclease/phosphatase family metal-dependent hydrolase
MSIVDALKLDVQERTAKAGTRIDYIYVSPGVKVHSYRTDPSPRPGTQLYPSDHFPSTAVIQLP